MRRIYEETARDIEVGLLLATRQAAPANHPIRAAITRVWPEFSLLGYLREGFPDRQAEATWDAVIESCRLLGIASGRLQ